MLGRRDTRCKGSTARADLQEAIESTAIETQGPWAEPQGGKLPARDPPIHGFDGQAVGRGNLLGRKPSAGRLTVGSGTGGESLEHLGHELAERAKLRTEGEDVLGAGGRVAHVAITGPSSWRVPPPGR